MCSSCRRFSAVIACQSSGSDWASVVERLNMIVRATSLGDVHTMMLYPAMSSHRDIAPKQRERMGIRENLVRLSVGVEAV